MLLIELYRVKDELALLILCDPATCIHGLGRESGDILLVDKCVLPDAFLSLPPILLRMHIYAHFVLN